MTYTFSSLSSASPSLEIASAKGLPPVSMVSRTDIDPVSMATTFPPVQSVAYSVAPVGVSASPMTSEPTSIS